MAVRAAGAASLPPVTSSFYSLSRTIIALHSSPCGHPSHLAAHAIGQSALGGGPRRRCQSSTQALVAGLGSSGQDSRGPRNQECDLEIDSQWAGSLGPIDSSSHGRGTVRGGSE